MPPRASSRVGFAVLAVVAVVALSAAAATFDTVQPATPDAATPSGDANGGGEPAATWTETDPSGSLGALARPFAWRSDVAASTPDVAAGGGVAVVLALAALVVCALGVVALLTGSDHATAELTEESPGDATAGAAAARPRWRVDADENAVYRAWRRFADRVDAPPSESPAELAAAARARGFDEGVVRELTAAFREVRYGGRPATREREERATAAIDRLEDDA